MKELMVVGVIVAGGLGCSGASATAPKSTSVGVSAEPEAPPLVRFESYDHYREVAANERSPMRMVVTTSLGAGCRCHPFNPVVPDRDLVELLLETDQLLPLMDMSAHWGG